MADTFVLPDFIRVIDLQFLAEYSSKRGLTFTPEPLQNEEKPYEQFIRFMDTLPSKTQDEIEIEFQEMNDITFKYLLSLYEKSPS